MESASCGTLFYSPWLPLLAQTLQYLKEKVNCKNLTQRIREWSKSLCERNADTRLRVLQNDRAWRVRAHMHSSAIKILRGSFLPGCLWEGDGELWWNIMNILFLINTICKFVLESGVKTLQRPLGNSCEIISVIKHSMVCLYGICCYSLAVSSIE